MCSPLFPVLGRPIYYNKSAERFVTDFSEKRSFLSTKVPARGHQSIQQVRKNKYKQKSANKMKI